MYIAHKAWPIRLYYRVKRDAGKIYHYTSSHNSDLDFEFYIQFLIHTQHVGLSSYNGRLQKLSVSTYEDLDASPET